MINISPASIDGPVNQVPTMMYGPQSGGSISRTNSSPGTNVFIKSQFPNFVSEDHPKFLDFMEEYYKWMETKDGVLYQSRHLKRNRDIDTAGAEHEEHLLNEFLSIVPKDVLANKATLLKHAKQFYTARGTEKSFKFFFRVLFNSDSKIYYPKSDILRVSDGKWIQNKTLRVVAPTGSIKNFRAQKIVSGTNRTIAFVERVYGINFGGFSAYELVLNTSSITGKFSPGETITTLDNSVSATITPIAESVKIIRRGKNYRVGDRFKINHVGTGAVIRVASVDASGAILKFYVEEFGAGYSTQNPPVRLYLTDDNHQQTLGEDNTVENVDAAIVSIELGSTTNYPGYFRNEDGQPSARKYIHDGTYYQQFSYVTHCNQSVNNYSTALKKILHPIGFKHFSAVSVESVLRAPIKTGADASPISIKTQARIRAAMRRAYTHIIAETRPILHINLGPSFQSIIRDKFSYKPFMQYDANLDMVPSEGSPNHRYYGPALDSEDVVITTKLSNTPVGSFVAGATSLTNSSPYNTSIGPKQLETKLREQTPFLPDAAVIINPDRVSVSVVSNTSFTLSDASEVAQVSFAIENNSQAPISWKVVANGKNVLLSQTHIELLSLKIVLVQVRFVSKADGQYTYSISHTLFGDEVTSTITVPHNEFRLALFAEDNLERTYKSNNVGIKLLEPSS